MVHDTAAAGEGGAEGAGGGAASREREIGELEFLVGNAASRSINLLMAGDRDRAALREEMAYLSRKAGRLAELLSEVEEA